MATVGVEGLSY